MNSAVEPQSRWHAKELRPELRVINVSFINLRKKSVAKMDGNTTIRGWSHTFHDPESTEALRPTVAAA